MQVQGIAHGKCERHEIVYAEMNEDQNDNGTSERKGPFPVLYRETLDDFCKDAAHRHVTHIDWLPLMSAGMQRALTCGGTQLSLPFTEAISNTRGAVPTAPQKGTTGIEAHSDA